MQVTGVRLLLLLAEVGEVAIVEGYEVIALSEAEFSGEALLRIDDGSGVVIGLLVAEDRGEFLLLLLLFSAFG